ncbi:phage minor head protein [Methanoregula sp.]|jgi:hypothetical protein|uniref:phage minor head protein n=1 Tax=Methanoregula sp. TaxID=2052170 RepID=UPI00356AE68A
MIPAALSRAITRFTTATIGYQKVRDKDRIARNHEQHLRAFFEEQSRLTLMHFTRMREYFPPDIPIKALEAGNPAKTEALKKLDKIWSDIEKETDEDLQNVILGVEKDGILSGADQLKGQLKYDPKTTFSLANPRAVKYFKETGGSLKYIKDIQDTTRDRLKTIITDALDTGQSYSKTAKIISDAFNGEIGRDRARLIAVTESARSYETGNHIFAQSIQEDGVKMEKSWQNSGDGKVSEGCLENSAAGWIPIDEDFPSGDQEPPRFPGCRCWAIYREARA